MSNDNYVMMTDDGERLLVSDENEPGFLWYSVNDLRKHRDLPIAEWDDRIAALGFAELIGTVVPVGGTGDDLVRVLPIRRSVLLSLLTQGASPQPDAGSSGGV